MGVGKIYILRFKSTIAVASPDRLKPPTEPYARRSMPDNLYLV